MPVMRTPNEKRLFAERLVLALKAKGIPPGPTKLADMLSMHVRDSDGLETVSPQAVDKWLKGKALPSPERMEALVELLGVAESWLRYGVDNTQPDGGSSIMNFAETERFLVLQFRNLSRENQALVHQIVKALGECSS